MVDATADLLVQQRAGWKAAGSGSWKADRKVVLTAARWAALKAGGSAAKRAVEWESPTADC